MEKRDGAALKFPRINAHFGVVVVVILPELSLFCTGTNFAGRVVKIVMLSMSNIDICGCNGVKSRVVTDPTCICVIVADDDDTFARNLRVEQRGNIL